MALLSQRSLRQAARVAGTDERTLRRWLSDDASFQAAFAEARRSTFQIAMDRIQAVTGRAVEALEDLLAQKQHPNVRLGAARTILELSIHRHDAETIVERLAALESRQREVI